MPRIQFNNFDVFLSMEEMISYDPDITEMFLEICKNVDIRQTEQQEYSIAIIPKKYLDFNDYGDFDTNDLL